MYIVIILIIVISNIRIYVKFVSTFMYESILNSIPVPKADLLGLYPFVGLELKVWVRNFSIKFKPNWNRIWFLELQFWNQKRFIGIL